MTVASNIQFSSYIYIIRVNFQVSARLSRVWAHQMRAAAFLKTYYAIEPRLRHIISSAGECGNSGIARIRKSVSYMSQDRAIVYTKVFDLEQTENFGNVIDIHSIIHHCCLPLTSTGEVDDKGLRVLVSRNQSCASCEIP
ncbi:hypothetical protein B0H14DRAFT_595118 [Mycena olivaceomarginata]|nr:hypothetical protein B0H14DRAFT_595118 [Mycena olivaceomarginata]